MVFRKKKKEQKAEVIDATNTTQEDTKEDLPPEFKANIKAFNEMLGKYGLLTPDNFKNEVNSTQCNLLFAIYMEIKGLREDIKELQDE